MGRQAVKKDPIIWEALLMLVVVPYLAIVQFFKSIGIFVLHMLLWMIVVTAIVLAKPYRLIENVYRKIKSKFS